MCMCTDVFYGRECSESAAVSWFRWIAGTGSDTIPGMERHALGIDDERNDSNAYNNTFNDARMSFISEYLGMPYTR